MKRFVFYIRGVFIALFVISLSIALYHDSVVLKKVLASPPKEPKIVKIMPAQEVTPTNTPIPTISPTPASPSATIINYTGYCLNVPVLYYHHVQPWDIAQAHGQTSLSVTPDFFDQQMAYVAAHYTTISAQQLVDALHTHAALPQNAMVVSLDDAYEDNYQYAYPIAKKYNVKLSLMVPTGLLGGVGNNSYFTWDQLKEMVNSGLVYAYDHTWSHYPVGTGTIEKDQFEIMTAKQQLESTLGKPVTIFTNPYGTGANNPRVVAELQQDGFTGAFSTIGGTYQCDSFVFSLHRTHVGNAPLSTYGL